MADEQQGVITAVTASSAAVDDTALVPELLKQHQQRCRKPRRVVGDHLYGSQDCLAYLQERGIETVIRERKGGNKHGGFDKSEFVYEADRDVYRCPAGEVLRRRRTHKRGPKGYYSADKQVCGSCSLREKCVCGKAPEAVRQITRFDTPYLERAQAACAGALGRRLLRKRQTCIEGLFGQAKEHHGMRRARWRGLVKMQMQALLTATVLNVKKLLKVAPRREVLADRVAVFGGEILFLFKKFWLFCCDELIFLRYGGLLSKYRREIPT
jgi:hypothetical protein